jgi:RNA polymerase sigma factor (sigma-70 family)
VGPTVADDLASEAFLRALRSKGLPVAGAERAWLYGIATNLLRERSRKEIRRLRAYARAPVSPADASEQDAAAARLDAVAMAKTMASELAGLDAAERETFLLYALTELDYAGIAVAMNVPIGTVRSRLHRARRRLRNALGYEEIDPGGTTTIETRHA